MADEHPKILDFFKYLRVYIAEPETRTVSKAVLMHYWIRPFGFVLLAETFWHFVFKGFGL